MFTWGYVAKPTPATHTTRGSIQLKKRSGLTVQQLDLHFEQLYNGSPKPKASELSLQCVWSTSVENLKSYGPLVQDGVH